MLSVERPSGPVKLLLIKAQFIVAALVANPELVKTCANSAKELDWPPKNKPSD